MIGFGLAVAGAWWAITERMPRRAIGIVGAAVGVSAIVVALLRTTPVGEHVAARLVVMAVLLGAAVGLGRTALVRDLHVHDELRPVDRLPTPAVRC